jgi:hypothetical protein
MRIATAQPTPELPHARRGGDSHQGMVGGRLLEIMTRHTSHIHGMNLMDIAHKAKLPWQNVRLNLSKMERAGTVRHFFRNEDYEWENSLWYVSVPLPLKTETANGGMDEEPTRPLGVESAHCERGVESSNVRISGADK